MELQTGTILESYFVLRLVKYTYIKLNFPRRTIKTHTRLEVKHLRIFYINLCM